VGVVPNKALHLVSIYGYHWDHCSLNAERKCFVRHAPVKPHLFSNVDLPTRAIDKLSSEL
jgi:hypothetical protein